MSILGEFIKKVYPKAIKEGGALQNYYTEFKMKDRKYPRKNYEAKVSLQLNEHIKGNGYTKNISIDGICISSPELFFFPEAGTS